MSEQYLSRYKNKQIWECGTRTIPRTDFGGECGQMEQSVVLRRDPSAARWDGRDSARSPYACTRPEWEQWGEMTGSDTRGRETETDRHWAQRRGVFVLPVCVCVWEKWVCHVPAGCDSAVCFAHGETLGGCWSHTGESASHMIPQIHYRSAAVSRFTGWWAQTFNLRVWLCSIFVFSSLIAEI